MTEAEEMEAGDAFAGPEPKSSAGVWSALKKAEKDFESWNAVCSNIDAIYSLTGSVFGGAFAQYEDSGWSDSKLDLFWSSYEILKPAVYAKPPIPAVAPLFQDNKQLSNVTAECLERTAISTFKVTGIDDVMTEVRDDLLFTNRGVMWLRYDTDDGQQVCIEHLDRTDFLHEPARKWSEVGWVARRAWLTRKEMRKRFAKTSGKAYQDAQYKTRRDRSDDDNRSVTKKSGVWEVWHKADDKVYWVTEGVDVFLDNDTPHLKLSDFFPCPRPAYGTLQRRSLIPVPDWERYATHFQQISTLTGRIYLLLEKVRMKGLIAAGGDIGDAVEELIRSEDDEILIPVPSAAMMATGGAANIVSWLPLNDVAQAIQGLIEARKQLIDDFYQLSGISDIMRGATEAEETLGAQQLKSQYGSVRVRGKIDELQRVAAEAVKIAAEIIAENFSKETLLVMSQMEIYSKAAIEKRVNDIEKAAKQELDALAAKAKDLAAQQPQQQPGPMGQPMPGQAQAQPQQVDPAQAQQMLQQAQQQIIQKYAPMLAEAQSQVPIEDVMKLLRDSKARGFTFEIETDSTILTDEMQEKASRNEFVAAFTQAATGLMQMAAMGEEGAALSGELMKFQLAPYRVGRQLSGAIDKFIDAAPEMAAKAAATAGQGQAGAEELAKAQQTLADAETMKAQATMLTAQARASQAQADSDRKIMEMQQKGAIEADKHQRESEKLQQQMRDMSGRETLLQAQVDNLTANTAKILASIGLDEREQQLSEYTAATEAESRQAADQLEAQRTASDLQGNDREHDRADRKQDFTEQSNDRQQTFAERQAASEGEQ